MLNLNETSYPYYTYNPSRIGASIFAIIVYISLIIWFIRSLNVKCRPRPLAIFIFAVHLVVFIELVLRATLSRDLLNTKTFYRITAPLINVPPRLLLIANYHCLVELRGKKPRSILDRSIDIIVPVGAISADILLGIANELSFKQNYLQLSFHLRQASATIILLLSILFYIIWYLGVSSARRHYELPLLAVSSTCVLIEAIYVLLLSIPKLFFIFQQNEFAYYIGHLIPIVLALTTWTIFHPYKLLPPLEQNVPHDGTGKELLPPPPTTI